MFTSKPFQQKRGMELTNSKQFKADVIFNITAGTIDLMTRYIISPFTASHRGQRDRAVYLVKSTEYGDIMGIKVREHFATSSRAVRLSKSKHRMLAKFKLQTEHQ